MPFTNIISRADASPLIPEDVVAEVIKARLPRAPCSRAPGGGAARLSLAEPASLPLGPEGAFAVLHGLYRLSANLARDRPLALLVDDAHWADAASLRFLAYLGGRLSQTPQ